MGFYVWWKLNVRARRKLPDSVEKTWVHHLQIAEAEIFTAVLDGLLLYGHVASRFFVILLNLLIFQV